MLTSVGVQAHQQAGVRIAYDIAAAGLDPYDVAGRTALKAQARANSPPIFKGYVQLVRSKLGPRAGSVGRANVSNVGVNRASARIGLAGRALVAVSIGISVYKVSTADDQLREAFVQTFGFAGAVGGGVVGGLAGSAVGPLGTIGGSVVGAAGGGIGGEYIGGRVYDILF